MDASAARKVTEKVLSSMDKVEDAIMHRAREGCYGVSFTNMSDVQIDILKTRGYRVMRKGDGRHLVSWDEEKTDTDYDDLETEASH